MENDESYNYSHGANWNFPLMQDCINKTCYFESAWVQSCLAQPASALQAECTISISISLLLAVIICNAIKFLCLLAVLLTPRFYPLVTVGDAVCSFMERHDPTTAGYGPLSMFDTKEHLSKNKAYREIIRGPLSFSHSTEYFSRTKSSKGTMQHNISAIRTWKPQTRRWSSLLKSPFPIFGFLL